MTLGTFFLRAAACKEHRIRYRKAKADMVEIPARKDGQWTSPWASITQTPIGAGAVHDDHQVASFRTRDTVSGDKNTYKGFLIKQAVDTLPMKWTQKREDPEVLWKKRTNSFLELVARKSP